MKRLKTYESFEVVMTKSTNEIISSYGLTMDDIEELFLEFSDMGYRIRIMPTSGVGPYGIDKNAGLFVDIVGNFPESKKNSIDPYSPEISLMIKRIIRNSTRLGLRLAESPRRIITSRLRGEWSGFIRFTLKKTTMDLAKPISRKTYESFGHTDFSPEMISLEEYQRVKKSGIHLRFSMKDIARLYRDSIRNIKWNEGNQRRYVIGHFGKVIKNVELKFSTRFEIISLDRDDEPFVYFEMTWGYRNNVVDWRETLIFPPDSKLYGRMEYEDFEMVIRDAKFWQDFCVNIGVEEDRKTHKILKESVFGGIPDPEIMTDNEYDEEVNNGKEENFNQKEKELLISLSDTIPLEHKPFSPEFLDYQINFSLTNGDDGIYPELKSKDVIKGITLFKNEDEFYYVNVWDRNDNSVTKSYRCDGYECWEKFIKEIFQGYRNLINQKGNKSIKESVFSGVPDPEPMTVDEWDDEVTNAEEVDFNQKEKELFISLSDTISLKNKSRSMPDIGKSYLYFQLLNGNLKPKLKETTPISNISIYKNDDEFYFVGLWSGDGLFAERELWAGGEKLYRCDGYECWEKFLKEIFQGYRDLTNK